MQMRLHRGLRLVATLAALAAPDVVRAQGFGLNEIGTCAIGRGFAVTSRPCDDASAIYWNPAALTRLQGSTASAGATAVQVIGSFTHDPASVHGARVDEGDVPVEVPPYAFYNWTGSVGSRRAALGVGVYVPYGLTSQWEQNFPGRFTAQHASLATIYIQPNFAIELAPGWSIGVGPVFGHSSVELRQSVDLSTVQARPGVTFGQLGIAPLTEFARAKLEGSANGWGFNVGLHGRINDEWQFGARYLHGIDFEYEGADATFEQVTTGLILPTGNPINPTTPVALDPLLAAQFSGTGALAPQTGNAKISHPAQAQAGLAWSGLRDGNTTVAVEANWIGYSAFDTIPLDFSGGATDRELLEEYDDSWSIRTGLENRYVGRYQGWSSRLGFSYVKTPAPDVTVTPLLPDMDRFNYMLGVGIPLGRAVSLDAAYLRVETPGRRGRIVERTDVQQTAADLNSGFFRLKANIFSLGLRAQF
jgi:long-chain fatty acid transport protein